MEFILDLGLRAVFYLYGHGWRLSILAPILAAFTGVVILVLTMHPTSVLAWLSLLVMLVADVMLIVDLIRSPPEMDPSLAPNRLRH